MSNPVDPSIWSRLMGRPVQESEAKRLDEVASHTGAGTGTSTGADEYAQYINQMNQIHPNYQGYQQSQTAAPHPNNVVMPSSFIVTNGGYVTGLPASPSVQEGPLVSLHVRSFSITETPEGYVLTASDFGPEGRSFVELRFGPDFLKRLASSFVRDPNTYGDD